MHPYRQSAYKLYYALAVEAQRYNVHETEATVSPSPVEIQHEHKCSTWKLHYWRALDIHLYANKYEAISAEDNPEGPLPSQVLPSLWRM